VLRRYAPAIALVLMGCARDCPPPAPLAGSATAVAAVAPPPDTPHVIPSEGKNPMVFGIDLVVMALIGPPGCPVEPLIEQAAKGEMTPVVIDLALYAAMSSVQPSDHVDHARFARLLRYAEIQRSIDRDTNAFSPPTPDEIAHWRAVALGKQ